MAKSEPQTTSPQVEVRQEVMDITYPKSPVSLLSGPKEPEFWYQKKQKGESVAFLFQLDFFSPHLHFSIYNLPYHSVIPPR